MPVITGTIQDEAESVFAGLVQFENLDAPCIGGVRVTGLNTISVLTGADGSLPDGFRLAPGRTRLIINGVRSKPFRVPDSNGSFNLRSLMASSTLITRVIVLALTIAELRSYASSASNFKAEVFSDANGAYAVFKWDASAANGDDGNQYIRPDDFETAGLWVRIL
jgi:hypothetical protein